MDAVNASGEVYLTHTVVDGRVALRMAIGAPTHRARGTSSARPGELPSPHGAARA